MGAYVLLTQLGMRGISIAPRIAAAFIEKRKNQILMSTTLHDSKIDEREEAQHVSDPALIRKEINEALRRMDKSLAASKTALSDTLEEGRVSAERLVKLGRDVAEDYIDSATYQLKRNPGAVVAVAFGVGAIAGVLFGLLTPRGGRKLAFTSCGSPKEER